VFYLIMGIGAGAQSLIDSDLFNTGFAILTLVSSFFLWKGHAWARWVLAVAYGLVGVLAFIPTVAVALDDLEQGW
jgi:hypothetical protein